MKSKIYSILAATLFIGLATSCDESTWETTFAEGQGGIDLSTLNIAINRSETVVSRAGEDVSNYLVSVKDKTTEQVMGEWIYAEMPEILTLPAGENYEVTVESHKIKDAEWENPYYTGSETFSITSGKITKVATVTAKFSSLKVSIKFADELKPVLGEDVKVVVKGINGSELTYTPAETKSGYFAIDDTEGNATFAAHFSGTVDGVETTSETAFKNVKAGEHHILTYGVKATPEIPEQTGDIDQPGISMDVEYNVEDVNGNTTVEEDILDSSDRPGQEEIQDPTDPEDPEDPGKEEPGEEKKPIYFEAENSPNLNINGINYLTEEKAQNFGNAVVKVVCENGVEGFHVNISSDEEEFLKAIDDLKLRDFELTDPGQAEQNLRNLSLPCGDEVKGKDVVLFDITKFVGVLTIYSGNHTFTLTVTDGNNTSSLELKFNVVK